jgi:hypothetical protein
LRGENAVHFLFTSKCRVRGYIVPPKMKVKGYMYPQMIKPVGMLPERDIITKYFQVIMRYVIVTE